MKSINSQSARNAGVAALGFASVLILWHLVGYYALISCVIGGVGTYANNVYYDNTPSKLDPAFTTLGGGLFALLMYAVRFL